MTSDTDGIEARQNQQEHETSRYRTPQSISPISSGSPNMAKSSSTSFKWGTFRSLMKDAEGVEVFMSYLRLKGQIDLLKIFTHCDKMRNNFDKNLIAELRNFNLSGELKRTIDGALKGNSFGVKTVEEVHAQVERTLKMAHLKFLKSDVLGKYARTNKAEMKWEQCGLSQTETSRKKGAISGVSIKIPAKSGEKNRVTRTAIGDKSGEIRRRGSSAPGAGHHRSQDFSPDFQVNSNAKIRHDLAIPCFRRNRESLAELRPNRTFQEIENFLLEKSLQSKEPKGKMGGYDDNGGTDVITDHVKTNGEEEIHRGKPVLALTHTTSFGNDHVSPHMLFGNPRSPHHQRHHTLSTPLSCNDFFSYGLYPFPPYFVLAFGACSQPRFHPMMHYFLPNRFYLESRAPCHRVSSTSTDSTDSDDDAALAPVDDWRERVEKWLEAIEEPGPEDFEEIQRSENHDGDDSSGASGPDVSHVTRCQNSKP